MKEQQQIKNIIFDLGGVILNIDYKKTEAAFKKLGVTDFDRIYSQSRQSGIFDRLETGKLSPEEFADELRTMTRLETGNEEIFSAWNTMLLDLPAERIQLIENLKKDYTTFLFSNTNAIHYDAFHEIIKREHGLNGLEPLFHKVYYSHLVGKRKPDVATFEFILNENRLSPSETIFIDDSEQHVEGAEKAGIRAHLLPKGTDVTELIPDLLAKFDENAIG